jgi:hypothetical protein
MEKLEQPPSPENIESQISELLGQLWENYRLDQFPEEAQDRLAEEWYDAEMEANVGADRGKALEHLRQFMDKLAKTSKKEG